MARVKRRTIKRVARHEGIDPNLFLALVNQESGRRKHVVSPAGAIGPTQLMPGTAASLGVNPNNPIQNLRGGAHYLHEQLQKFGNVKDALAAYNAGPGNVQKYGGVPPFAETQAYVRNILAAAGNPSVTMGTAKTGNGGLGPQYVTTPGTQVTIPGQDFTRQRQLAELNYFMNDRGKPGSLVALAQQLQGLQNIPAQTKTIPGRRVRVTGPQGPPRSSPQADAKLTKILSEAKYIDRAKVPYLWGGGHQSKQIRGSKVTPLDCSGAVSRVLGIDPRVSGQFETWGKPGKGKHVTIYANGEHVLMEINGRFWGTSHSNPGGGAGWIDGNVISKSYLRNFVARHPNGL